MPINYTTLMDLRIDYAFKLLFTKGDPLLLISLLNSIFANKKIPRIIKTLTIKNPYLEKESEIDKLSILDIRAELEDNTTVLIEMHMYGLGELKAKTIRSWARAYGEELEPGDSYTEQPPTITIAFTNGAIPMDDTPNADNQSQDKIHRLCMIMDCEDHTIFTNAMELHYIDMKAFATAVNETNSIETISTTEEAKFTKWLSLITQKEITNKAIIETACKEEEEISMAVTALAMQSEDKITRQAYQRRKDEIYFYKKNMSDLATYKRRAKNAETQLATQKNQLATQKSQLAEKDALIAKLQAQLKDK